MSRLDVIRAENLPADARAVLSYSTSADWSSFFGIEESDAIIDSGILEKVMRLMFHPILAEGSNAVLDRLREEYGEDEFCVYVSVSNPEAPPVSYEDLSEEDFEEDGETVRSDRYTCRVDLEMVEELDFDLYDHPAMEVIDYSSGSYDHKRKYVDLSADIETTVGRLLQFTPADLTDWSIQVATKLGMTEVNAP